jgi:hypothetical protein
MDAKLHTTNSTYLFSDPALHISSYTEYGVALLEPYTSSRHYYFLFKFVAALPHCNPPRFTNHVFEIVQFAPPALQRFAFHEPRFGKRVFRDLVLGMWAPLVCRSRLVSASAARAHARRTSGSLQSGCAAKTPRCWAPTMPLLRFTPCASAGAMRHTPKYSCQVLR